MKTLIESAERFLGEDVVGGDIYTLEFMEQDGGKIIVQKNGERVNASVSDVSFMNYDKDSTVELSEYFDSEEGKAIDISEFCRQHNCRLEDERRGWSTKNQAWVAYKLVGEVINDPAFEALESYRNSRADSTSIEEGKDVIGQELLDKIAELTDENDHNGAVMVLAQFLKEKKHIRIMKAIQELHSAYGHMPSELIDLRSFELKELIKLVAEKYGDDIAQKVKGAF